MQKLPKSAATCNGVSPFWLTAFGLALFLVSKITNCLVPLKKFFETIDHRSHLILF